MVGGDTNHGGKDKSIMWQVGTPTMGAKINLLCGRWRHLPRRRNAIGGPVMLGGCNSTNTATSSDGWWGHQPWREVWWQIMLLKSHSLTFTMLFA